MELSNNIKRYIYLYNKQNDSSDNEKEEIFSLLEEIYYKLNEEEVAFLELKGYI
jgi:hypothetical protein